MALIRYLSDLNFSAYPFGDFSWGSVTATATTATYTLGSQSLVISGNFSLADGEVTDGIVSQIAFRSSGANKILIQNLALDFGHFSDYLSNNDLGAIVASSDEVRGNALSNRLEGFAGDDLLNGLAGSDTLIGSYGNDTLDGGLGADSMIGGSGDDTYIVDHAADRIVEQFNGGTDLVETAASSYTLSANVENLTATGIGNFTGIGNNLNNLIIGSAGADLLLGGNGSDQLRGGNGNDTLNGGNGDDYLIGDAGSSYVTTATSRTVSIDPLRNISVSLIAPEVVPPDAGGSSSVTVSGYVNNASLSSSTFNLAFVLDVSGSMSTSFSSGTPIGDLNNDGQANTCLDAVVASFEQLVASINAAGLGDLVNIGVIPFESSADLVSIGTGTADADANGTPDVIDAVQNLDILGGTEYGLALQKAIDFFGSAPPANNYVFFLSDGAPNDNGYEPLLTQLRDPGGINAVIRSLAINTDNSSSYYNLLDLLDDGTANQTAIAVTDPSTLDAGLIGSGFDTAQIGALELYLDGTLIATLNGDQLESTPFGLKYSVTIPGLSSTETNRIETRLVLSDETGTSLSTSQFLSVGVLDSNDRLLGGAGNDTLDGGSGVDTLVGGIGDDLYIVHANNTVISEVANAGRDTIEADFTFSLNKTALAQVENLSLTGSNSINGTGNAQDNVIKGNIGNNTLEGRQGDDTLIGGFGNDTATYASATGNIIASLLTGASSGSAGNDILVTIENVTGGAFNDALTGDANANVLRGLNGNDTLIGGYGNDTLWGGQWQRLYRWRV